MMIKPSGTPSSHKMIKAMIGLSIHWLWFRVNGGVRCNASLIS
jgi:hypothetical protein